MPKLSSQPPQIRVLMVCLGNICRSPTAQGVFEKKIKNKGLSDKVIVDSAGTGDWHIGSSPDRRSTAAAARRGYDLSSQRARQVSATDFVHFDYILAMDRTNLKELRALCPSSQRTKPVLLLDFADSSHDAVPDPYYSGEDGFELVLSLIEEACDGLITHLLDRHPQLLQP